MINEEEGMAAKIFATLKNVPLRMISYGGSKNNVSILVDSTYKNKALNELNNGLFTF
jgi:aspartate kinase